MKNHLGHSSVLPFSGKIFIDNIANATTHKVLNGELQMKEFLQEVKQLEMNVIWD